MRQPATQATSTNFHPHPQAVRKYISEEEEAEMAAFEAAEFKDQIFKVVAKFNAIEADQDDEGGDGGPQPPRTLREIRKDTPIAPGETDCRTSPSTPSCSLPMCQRTLPRHTYLRAACRFALAESPSDHHAHL